MSARDPKEGREPPIEKHFRQIRHHQSQSIASMWQVHREEMIQ